MLQRKTGASSQDEMYGYAYGDGIAGMAAHKAGRRAAEHAKRHAPDNPWPVIALMREGYQDGLKDSPAPAPDEGGLGWLDGVYSVL